MTDDFVRDWAAADLESVTLPSGREVRISLPAPRDLVARGLLPIQLIQDVLAFDKAGGDMDHVSEEDPELGRRLSESLQTLAADSIRQGRRSADDEWRPISVPPETYALLPKADRLAIENRIEATLTEADAAVDRLREFHGKPTRAPRRKSRGTVRATAVDAAPGDAGGDRPRHRARRAAREG